jgi:hypothetical protein
VTTWWAIAGKSADHLEDVLGFGRRTLADGYRVYRLAEPVELGDFQWLDTTRYSGGWELDPTINEFVQRADALRWTLYKKSGFNAKEADAGFDGFMGAQQQRLNVRSGWAFIVKVVPNTPLHIYPDSVATRIPQWTLRHDRKKRFTLMFDVKPGRPCPARLPSA